MNIESLEARIRKAVPPRTTRKVSSLAKSLRVPRSEIIDAAENMDGFTVNVGVGAFGGWAALPRSRWEVENLGGSE